MAAILADEDPADKFWVGPVSDLVIGEFSASRAVDAVV